LGDEAIIESVKHKETHTKLDVPSSLPDTLIDKYGLETIRKREEKKYKDEEHPQRLPSDLTNNTDFLEKFPEETAKIESVHVKEPSIKEYEEEQMKKIEETIIKRIQKSDENIQAPVLDVKEINGKEKEEIENKKTEYYQPSFFDELEGKLSKGDEKLHETFSQGIVAVMKKYHDARIKGEHFFFHEKDREDILYKKMLKLKELEKEWLIRARELNSAKELLEDKEREIDLLSHELKEILQKANKYKIFNKTTGHNTAFRLINGKILLSLNDLMQELKNINEDVFSYHVNNHKNDFSEWVQHVFDQKKLALLLKNCKNKEEMFKLLKEY